MNRQLTFTLPKRNNYNLLDLLIAFGRLDGIDSAKLQQANDTHWFIVMSINPRATIQDVFNAGTTASKILISRLHEC